ncbi:MAG: hypothetical protein SPJ15_05965 [Anaerococcus sp.]|nr:hypothetical protein [Anaerococcus sp.]
MGAGFHGNFGNTKGTRDRVPIRNKNDVEYNKNKMENYLLNNEHPEGKSKAKFLKDVLGYKSGDGKTLHDHLVNAVINKKPVKVENTSYEIKNTYKIKLVGKNNEKITANVVCIFQKDSGQTKYRIITVYPDKR